MNGVLEPRPTYTINDPTHARRLRSAIAMTIDTLTTNGQGSPGQLRLLKIDLAEIDSYLHQCNQTSFPMTTSHSTSSTQPSMLTPVPTLISLPDAARRRGCSRQYLLRIIETIPGATRVGRNWQLPETSVALIPIGTNQ